MNPVPFPYCTRPNKITWYDEDLKAAIIEQRKIGWRNFLEGLVSNKLTRYQQKHYDIKESKRKGSKWTRSIIKEGWNILHGIWLHRNNRLHEKETIEEMEGLPVLESTIYKEWNKGPGRLPLQEFSHFFRIKMDDMKSSSIETKKDWLATIKTARRLYDEEGYESDEFDKNQTLSQWIGLEFKKKR